MNITVSKLKLMLAVALTGILAAGPVLAEKHGGKGGKHARKHQHDERKKERRDRDAAAGDSRAHFEDRHRAAVRDYYDTQFRGGRCPPGLKKKHNGCLPPGQAKKWKRGRPLPRDVVYYPVPQTLVVEIGPPPSGYRYVRVASDILLIAIGSRMVVDAIQDFGR